MRRLQHLSRVERVKVRVVVGHPRGRLQEGGAHRALGGSGRIGRVRQVGETAFEPFERRGEISEALAVELEAALPRHRGRKRQKKQKPCRRSPRRTTPKSTGFEKTERLLMSGAPQTVQVCAVSRSFGAPQFQQEKGALTQNSRRAAAWPGPSRPATMSAR